VFGWLVADGWCWFVLREKYCWLVADGWFVLREKYCWLVADKPSEQAVYLPRMFSSDATFSRKKRAERQKGSTDRPFLFFLALLQFSASIFQLIQS
jgi:hypothetical protein